MIKKSLSAPAERLMSNWLTSEDVCQVLRVTTRTLTNYLNEGILHATKIGRRNYFKLSEIETKLEDNFGASQPVGGGIYGE